MTTGAGIPIDQALPPLRMVGVQPLALEFARFPPRKKGVWVSPVALAEVTSAKVWFLQPWQASYSPQPQAVLLLQNPNVTKALFLRGHPDLIYPFLIHIDLLRVSLVAKSESEGSWGWGSKAGRH